ncbi:hypothetical protein SAMN05444004_102329 [Jannaschia faecimaris]|uniref:Uncharacterized protein n=1 Tax=Jannaschia faecimaris TaxID=1244108 RepID=A0A1H3LVP9_9RHOB|nr:hypothetical protein SAMN05444004_102329 [Jannaschia faecimaris]
MPPLQEADQDKISVGFDCPAHRPKSVDPVDWCTSVSVFSARDLSRIQGDYSLTI